MRWRVTIALLSALPAVLCQLNGAELVRRYQHIERIERGERPYFDPAFLNEFHAHSILSNVDVFNVSVSGDCAMHLGLIKEASMAIYDVIKDDVFGRHQNLTLTAFDKAVLLPALDAAGKPGPGILSGHLQFHGLIHECLMIDFTPVETGKKYEMDFFRVFVDAGLRPFDAPNSCTSKFGLDLCLPRACKDIELLKVFQQLNFPVLHANPICALQNVNLHVQNPVTATYITYFVMGSILLTCVLSGIADYFLTDALKGMRFTRTLWWKVFMAFSFYRNVVEIFTTGGKSKQTGQIGPVHCIRFFSMCWIIMGHMLAIFLEFSSNPADVIEITKYRTTELLTNAFFSVDSFFFLSGLMLAFIWFKDYNKNKRRTMSLQSWVMFYLHRILRLSPPYFMIIFFWTYVFKTWLQDMPTFMSYWKEDPCPDNWWVNLLYLNNFIGHKRQCYFVSWYLSTDMQIYLFSPLILVPLALNPLVGMGVALGIIAISTAVNMWQVYHFYFPPSDYSLGLQDPRMKDFDDYTMLMYDAPYIRCQVYIIGMLVGWLLQNVKKMRINRILNVFLWGVSLSVMLAVVLGLHRWTLGNQMSLLSRALYNAFSKPAWGLALSWMIISCYYGYGGAVGDFMSWNIWVPLGRLTFCAYLTHVCVITFLIGLDQSEMIFSNFIDLFTSYIIPVIVITYLVSIVWSVAFELSLGKVEMLLLGGLRGRGPPPSSIQPTVIPVNTGDDYVPDKAPAAPSLSTRLDYVPPVLSPDMIGRALGQKRQTEGALSSMERTDKNSEVNLRFKL